MRNSRSKNFQPAHGLPNRPPVTVNCFQASTMPAIGTHRNTRNSTSAGISSR